MARGYAVCRVDVAPVEVWSVLADHEGMSGWLPGLTVRLERIGETERNGVGAIRDIRGPGSHIREEITGFTPPHRLAYVALSGVPLAGWRGEVELAEHHGGTAIRWTVTAHAPLPGGDLLLRMAAKALLFALVRAVRRQLGVTR